MKTMFDKRQIEKRKKIRMAQRRQVVRGHTFCDLCETAPAAERHHIYTRGLTGKGNEAARHADRIEVTALLCRECHQELADRPEKRHELLQLMIQLWGYQTIYNIHKNIEYQVGRVLWPLPEDL